MRLTLRAHDLVIPALQRRPKLSNAVVNEAASRASKEDQTMKRLYSKLQPQINPDVLLSLSLT